MSAEFTRYLTRMQERTATTGKVDLWPAAHQVKHVVDRWVNGLEDNRAEVLLWGSNGQSPMSDMLAAWFFLGLVTEAQVIATEAASDEQARAFIAEYRLNQPTEPSAEERFEARAAFGPGETVVDIFSGRRFTT